MGMGKTKRWLSVALGAAALAGFAGGASAQEAAAPTAADLETIQNNLNIVWTSVAAFLVFFMQSGCAILDAGMNRPKGIITTTPDLSMSNGFAFDTTANFMGKQ